MQAELETNVPAPGYNIQSLFRAQHTVALRCAESLELPQNGFLRGNHALAVPSRDPEEAEQYDAEVESIAMKVATAYEETFDAVVKDVSRPELARQVGLQDWPGFDLLSRRPPTADSPGQELDIEVKGPKQGRQYRGQRQRVGQGLQSAEQVLALRRL